MSIGTGIPTRIRPPYSGDDVTGIPTRIRPPYVTPLGGGGGVVGLMHCLLEAEPM